MTKNKLASKLRSLMDKQNLSAAQLERLGNMKIGTVTNILLGRSKNPTLETIIALTTALNCSVYDLINEKPEARLREDLNKNLDDNNCKINLLIDCLNLINIYTKVQTIKLDEIFFLLNKAYKYSLTKNNGIASEVFIQWLLEDFISTKY